MVDVVGDDRAAAGDFVADEFGGDEIGDGGAEALAVAGIFGEALAAEIFAGGDIFHLRRDDALTRVMHLADIHAGFGAEHALADIGEGLDSARTVGAELAVILGAEFALGDFLDIAAAANPVAAEFGETRHDVDAGSGVAVGAGRVVDAQGGLARGGFEVDFAHCDVQRADMDLAAAADRAGGDFEFGACGNIGHVSSTPFGGNGP